MRWMFGLLLALAACAPKPQTTPQKPPEEIQPMADPKKVTEEEWKKKLTPQQFYVTRMKGTEPAGSGEYDEFYDKGVYRCVCCKAELFSSDTKYKSHCGWPSFWAPFEGAVKFDALNGADGSEVMCARCDAHLGHLFHDGPKPTGHRY